MGVAPWRAGANANARASARKRARGSLGAAWPWSPPFGTARFCIGGSRRSTNGQRVAGREGAPPAQEPLIRAACQEVVYLADATSAGLQERCRQILNVPGGLVEIDGLLRVHPEVRRSPEGRTEPQRHLGRHSAAAVDDAVHDLDVAPQVARQNLLAQPERDEELLAENFPGDVGLRRRLRSLIFIPRLSGSP